MPAGLPPWQAGFVIGAPAVLALVELAHPQPHDLFALDLRTWMAVHYAQIALFPLAALAMAMLAGQGGGPAARCACLAMLVFAVSWVAFDTAAGVVTGILLGAAAASGAPEAWRAPILAIWTHPVVGGEGAPLLAMLGSLAWLAGALATAWALRRAGSSWMVLALLAVSGLGFVLFRTHAWPGGPVAFGALAAAALLDLRPRMKA